MVDCPYCGTELVGGVIQPPTLRGEIVTLRFENGGHPTGLVSVPPVCPCCSWAYSTCERAQLELDFLEALFLMPES